jgi:hypothetical protein
MYEWARVLADAADAAMTQARPSERRTVKAETLDHMDAFARTMGDPCRAD